MNERELNTKREVWLRAIGKPTPRDPLLDVFADDAVVAELTVDAEAQYKADVRQMICFTLMCPCWAIPGNIVTCYPCNLLCRTGTLYDEKARARHLVLRERSLVYRLDIGGPLEISVACCVGATPIVYDTEMVFPLDDDIDLIRGNTSGSDCCHSVDHLQLTYKGETVAMIEAPKNVDAFLELFNAQSQKAKASIQPSRAIDRNLQDMHEAISMYHQTLAVAPLPVIVVRGENTTTRLDNARAAFEGKIYYEQLERKLQDIRNRGSEGGAPRVAEIVRDLPLPIADQLARLTVSDILAVLNELGLNAHYAAFEKAGVDGAMMSVMDEATLQELGVTSGLDRKRLLAWVVKRQHQPAVHTALTMT